MNDGLGGGGADADADCFLTEEVRCSEASLADIGCKLKKDGGKRAIRVNPLISSENSLLRKRSNFILCGYLSDVYKGQTPNVFEEGNEESSLSSALVFIPSLLVTFMTFLSIRDPL